MRKAFLGVAICVAISAAATAQSQRLNVKTGEWQMTTVSAVNATLSPEIQAMLGRLPPAQQEALKSRFGGTPQTRTYKSCVTQADLDKYPFDDPNQRCTWTVSTSTSSDLEVHATICRANNRDMTGNIDVKVHAIDSENATGSVQMNLNGNNGQAVTSNATITGKWIGATCEAN